MQSFLAILIAALYGLIMRLMFGAMDGIFEVMSVAFIFLVPLGVGALTVRFSDPKKIKSTLYCFFSPWLSTLALLVITIILSVEGTICWIMIYPFFAAAAGMGGLIMRNYLLRRQREEKKDIDDRTLDSGDDFQNKGNLQVSLLLLLPFVAAWVEGQFDFGKQAYSAFNTIDIQAQDTAIWKNVTRVRTISEEEDQGGISRWLGMPRPIRAELDTLALGGQREAVFERGLVFHERVTDYEPLRRMAFSIRANPSEIPPTAMDEHIVVGGKYFDVLEGRYALEPLDNGHYRLHLSSHFTVHTSFNFYSGLWARWIMSDIQQNILQVIKRRAEQLD